MKLWKKVEIYLHYIQTLKNIPRYIPATAYTSNNNSALNIQMLTLLMNIYMKYKNVCSKMPPTHSSVRFA